MKLLSLSVENFRGIRRADLEFGPGLNVLYGPNDLGKSSLAAAIRAALLLQVTSREHEEFISWHGAGDPEITLVFESEPQRIWRVRKKFGAGHAFLDESRNGVDFNNVSRGREVDGRLSEILQWGLAPPGGKGRPKGLPMTFLSTVLMPEQDKVAAIFARALSEDSDGSGKKRLIEALQAVAENPLYKKVLSQVQARVDKAYSSTGMKKRGKDSPWVAIREKIQQKEADLRQCQEQLQKTESIETEMRILRARQSAGMEAVARAEAILMQIEAAHRQGLQRDEIVARLEQRKEALGAVETVMRELRQTGEQLARALEAVEKSAKRERSASQELEDATRRTQAAKDELARLQSEDRTRERLLQRESTQKHCAELRTRQVQTEASLAQVERARRAAVRVSDLGAGTLLLESAANAAKLQHERALKILEEAKRNERNMQAASEWLRCLDARQKLTEAAAGLAQSEAWRSAAREKRAAASLEAAEPDLDITPAQLQALQKLDRDLEVARASLRVGLEVSVRAQGKLRFSVSGDDGAWVTHELDGTVLETAAHREIAIAIDNIAGIVISGGSAEARRTAAGLQSRWAAEVEPVLARSGAVNLAGLARKIDESAARAIRVKEALTEAAQWEQRVADQPDWAALRLQRQAELTATENAIAGLDEAALEKLVRAQRIQGVIDAEKHLATIRRDLVKCTADERRLSDAHSRAAAALQESGRAMALARTEWAEAQTGIEGDWESALLRHRSERDAIHAELRASEERLTGLANDDVEASSQAQAALAKAETKRVEAEAAHEKAKDDLRKVENARSSIEGQLTLRKEAAARCDEAGARNAVAVVEAELALVPKPAHAVTADNLAEAGRQVRDARVELQAIADAILAKAGALQHVGGDVAKQHAADAEEALRAEREREQDVQNEFAAWDLLRNTLLEAEKEEGVHLGRALGGPIAQRFGELTHGRYGHMNLGPDLDAPSITAAGAPRDLSALSVGTRDQLSTIFRLTLAEYLKSAVVLDDQLTQTDTLRMAWLRDLIRDVTGRIQVLVFTCRPSDYLLPEEIHSAALGSAVRSIDLERAIERGGSDGSRAAAAGGGY